MKKDIKNKIVLIIVLIMFINIAFPTYSNAGKITSLITKPFQTSCMGVFDSINFILARTFALDSKAEGFVNELKELPDEIKEAWEADSDGDAEGTEGRASGNGGDGKGFIEKFQEALDNLEGTVEDLENVWLNLLLSPDDIFGGKVAIADANVFNIDSSWLKQAITPFGKLMYSVKKTVSGLYYVMRNLAAVMLLCLLIYCGIRIVLSSTNANEKAKWKAYLFDWLKALALVMFVHVLMIAIFYIAEVLIEGLKGSITGGNTIVTTIRQQFWDLGIFDHSAAWIYVFMYGYITYLTIVFLVAYFKRLFYVMFLIIIAPIISALYAFGKTTKSNFERWLKEFSFGVMVQPFHMLIYTLLLVTPIKLMGER